MRYIMVCLVLGLVFSSAFAADNESMQLAKQNLAEGHAKFVALKNSGLVNYKTKFDEARFQLRIDMIVKSQAILASEGSDLAASHRLASEALIGISGLKTAGSIGIVKPQARELYTKGYVALREAVVLLYHLKKNERDVKSIQTEQFNTLHSK